jgi:hypothetical protein
MVMIRATVLHSVGPGMFFGYLPGQSHLHLAHVFQLDVQDDVAAFAKPQFIAEILWTLCNVDGPEDLHGDWQVYAPQVAEYRRRRNRSLSMGDVVLLEKAWEDQAEPLGALHAVSVGWEMLEGFPPYFSDRDTPDVSASYAAHRIFAEAHR